MIHLITIIGLLLIPAVIKEQTELQRGEHKNV